MSRSPPRPSNASAAWPATSCLTSSPSTSARHPCAQPSIGVATEERHEVGSSHEQCCVDPLLAGHLAHPCRNERHRRAEVAVEIVVLCLRQVRRVLEPVGDGGQDLLGDAAAGVAVVDAAASRSARPWSAAPSGRCRAARGRAGPGGAGCRSPPPAARAMPRPRGATPRLRAFSVRVSFSRNHAASGSAGPCGRTRSSSQAASAQEQPALGLERGGQTIVELEQVLDIRRRVLR